MKSNYQIGEKSIEKIIGSVLLNYLFQLEILITDNFGRTLDIPHSRGDWSMPGHRVKRDSEGKNRKYQLI